MKDNGPAGITFHATFNFNRSRMAEVIAFVEARHPVGIVAKDLAATSLGRNMWPAFLEWGRVLNLLQRMDGKYHITPFGGAVLAVDPAMTTAETLWLMHFQLMRRPSFAPKGWREALSSVFSSGLAIDRAYVEGIISNVEDHVVPSSVEKSSQVLLNSYATADGFGHLELVKRDDKGKYHRSVSNLPIPPRAFESMLIQWWESEYPGHDTVLLTQICSARELTTFIGLDATETEGLLEALHRDNRLDVLRGAPPYHVLRYWNDDPNVWIDRYASIAGGI